MDFTGRRNAFEANANKLKSLFSCFFRAKEKKVLARE